MSAILTTEQMYEADRCAMAAGISGAQLMENAGSAVTAHICEHWDKCPVLILCGPGNNGGDGYVIARQLFEDGWPVTIVEVCGNEKLGPDASLMRDKCSSLPALASLPREGVKDFALIVDAVFGAGFKGVLPDELAAFFEEAAQQDIPIVSVDVPSGVNGTTGEIAAGAPRAAMTVTFFKAKPGHLLYPGRLHCGRLVVADIGISDHVLEALDVHIFENSPELWGDYFNAPAITGHKYDRGHCTIVGGGISQTGAARIAARTALRAGAGAATLLCAPSSLLVYAQALEAVMVSALDSADDLKEFIEKKRIHSILIGPANGVTDRTRAFVVEALKTDACVVLDADAITVFQNDPEELFTLIRAKKGGAVIMTPHEAEYKRVFDFEGNALERARAAAQSSGAVIILKGATTVVASPDGRVILNTHSSPWLATAGSGDALAGIVCGLLACLKSSFEAAASSVWIHGDAGLRLGPGMIAEDIEVVLPRIMGELTSNFSEFVSLNR